MRKNKNSKLKQVMVYADDDVTPVKRLVQMRLPSLMIGLLFGVLLSLVTGSFEEVLAKNVRVAFFIPFIVYLADAVGTQTQSIYIRDLRTGHANYHRYLVKETLSGLFLASILGVITFLAVFVMFKSQQLATAVSLGAVGAIISAPLIALTVAELFELEHNDPAVGAGPIATVIQDTVSVLIYGLIASAIIL